MITKQSRYEEGDNVLLPAQPDEDLPEQRATVVRRESKHPGMYILSIFEEDMLEDDEDGIVEVHIDDIAGKLS